MEQTPINPQEATNRRAFLRNIAGIAGVAVAAPVVASLIRNNSAPTASAEGENPEASVDAPAAPEGATADTSVVAPSASTEHVSGRPEAQVYDKFLQEGTLGFIENEDGLITLDPSTAAMQIGYDSVDYGDGSTLKLLRLSVPEKLRGRTARLSLGTSNNHSEHPGNKLVVVSGESRAEVSDVEVGDGRDAELEQFKLAGETMTVDMQLGESGMTSMMVDLNGSIEPNKTPDTTSTVPGTTSTVPGTTSSTVPGTTSSTVPGTTTTVPTTTTDGSSKTTYAIPSGQ